MEIKICGVAHKVKTFAGAKALAMRFGATRFTTKTGAWGFRHGSWHFYPKEERYEQQNVECLSKKEGWKIYHSLCGLD